MKKIPTLFVRDQETKLVLDEVTPGCEWVQQGAGRPTRKWDGTCCRVLDGELWKRYDAKKGKTPPPGFEPAQDPDTITGHHPGWLKVGDSNEDKWFREGWTNSQLHDQVLPDGTYELLGPKINGDPDHARMHMLVRHGLQDHQLERDCPTDYEGLKAYLAEQDMEGVVWWHPDGRMVKIKLKDFGIKRP